MNEALTARFFDRWKVQLQIAEARMKLAEIRYQVMVRRAQAWADKSRQAICPERIDGDR